MVGTELSDAASLRARAMELANKISASDKVSIMRCFSLESAESKARIDDMYDVKKSQIRLFEEESKARMIREDEQSRRKIEREDLESKARRSIMWDEYRDRKAKLEGDLGPSRKRVRRERSLSR